MYIVMFVGFFAYDILLNCLLLKQLSLFSQNMFKSFFFFFSASKGSKSLVWEWGFEAISWEPDSKYNEGVWVSVSKY